MADTETFIAFEEQVSKILLARWEKAVDAAWPAIEAAWERQQYDVAIELVGTIKQPAFTKAQRKKLFALGVAMLQAGALVMGDTYAEKWITDGVDLSPVSLAIGQLVALADEDTPAFTVRTLRTEAARQRGQQDDSPQAQFLAALFKDEDGPSSYAARNVVSRGGKWSSDLTANLTTSRLVNYGSLDAMVTGRVTTYRLRVTLDERTSTICRNLVDRTFTVTEGFNRLETALRTNDGGALRVIHPWIPHTAASNLPKMSSAELSANNWTTPPFHPRCRTTVEPVAEEDIREDVDVVPVTAPAPQAAGLGNTGAVLGASAASLSSGGLAGLGAATTASAVTLGVGALVETGTLARWVRQANNLMNLYSYEVDDVVADIAKTLRAIQRQDLINLSDFETAVRETMRRFLIDPAVVEQLARDLVEAATLFARTSAAGQALALPAPG